MFSAFRTRFVKCLRIWLHYYWIIIKFMEPKKWMFSRGIVLPGKFLFRKAQPFLKSSIHITGLSSFLCFFLFFFWAKNFCCTSKIRTRNLIYAKEEGICENTHLQEGINALPQGSISPSVFDLPCPFQRGISRARRNMAMDLTLTSTDS